MAKKHEGNILAGCLVWFTILVGMPWAIIKTGSIRDAFLLIFLLYVLAGIAYGVVVIIISGQEQAILGRHQTKARAQMKDELPALIDRHAATLERNLRTAIVKNDYGKVLSDDQEKKIVEFLDSVPLSFDWEQIETEAIEFTRRHLRDKRIRQKSQGVDFEDLPTDGIDFEFWVADVFRKFGWEANVTQSGGDQGLDIIVKRNGVSAGIQTKLYNSPVGNKAVQEAHAGANFYGLKRAAVLTNAGFTKSAKELAESTGVILMSHYDIPIAHELFPAR
ncbi:restriction endonuclease [Ruegeria arenilitoris]|uniref:restriction endonuclease n=1 Tax=Ruegeria arenilitoris TaxID=1173585 RepID=UPI0014805869|nr:restriction endonuclease [Ruegeria arenilitoris]